MSSIATPTRAIAAPRAARSSGDAAPSRSAGDRGGSATRPPLLAPRCACGGGCPRCVQAKPKLDTPGDRWEQEADRVADAVLADVALSGISPQPQRDAAGPDLQRVALSPQDDDAQRGQRDTQPEDEEDATGAAPTVQRLTDPASTATPPRQDWVAQLSHSAGSPLPAGLAADLGQHIGADFSAVRVHTDAHAAQRCDDVAARAFTHGRDLYFNRGEYQPHTRPGLRMLAHELAHVVQQGAAGPAGAHDPGSPPVQRMAALDNTNPRNLHDTDVQPWPQLPDARGDEYVVKTDAGSAVRAWVAYNSVAADERYWCHGFSLGTYERWGYSVWSGPQMQQVVADEYRRIPRAQAQAGDLAAWVLMPDGRLYGHSALFTQPVLGADGNLDTTRSRLDSKNGSAPLANHTLAEIMAVSDYGYNVAVYRHV